jgi:hypothetical protein
MKTPEARTLPYRQRAVSGRTIEQPHHPVIGQRVRIQGEVFVLSQERRGFQIADRMKMDGQLAMVSRK